MSVLAWLLSLVLSVALGRDVSASADTRTGRDGESVEHFVTLCAWVSGHPETMSCREASS